MYWKQYYKITPKKEEKKFNNEKIKKYPSQLTVDEIYENLLEFFQLYLSYFFYFVTKIKLMVKNFSL